jgi:16S rRNA (guanine527-N7)-methyltransferase
VSLEQQLDRGATDLGLAISQSDRAKLITYLGLLQKWNRVYNLTAIREQARLVSYHLLDSLAVVPHLSGGSIVDVGSGAGLPGIPLAIARPEWELTLLESNHKKGTFLKQAVIELGLPNVTVCIERSENWHPAKRADIAISRAFSDLAGFVDAIRHAIRPRGAFAAMKGVHPDEEIEQLSSDVKLESVIPLQVPGLRGQRHLVILRANQ